MYSLLLGAVLSVVAFTPVAAAPSVQARADSPAVFSRAAKLRFHLRAGSTGIETVDGQLLGARPKANTFVGFNLPYGQVPQVFTLDDKTSYVYAAVTGTGDKLLLSAVPRNDGTGTAAVKTAVAGSKGSKPIQCTSVGKSPRQILCGVNVNGTLYNKLLAVDFKNDTNYELAIGPAGGEFPQVALNVEPV